MTLHKPFLISSRLLPAVTVGEATISITYAERPGRDGRVRYQWFIDGLNLEASGDDLQSGCGGGSIQEGMQSLLSFLSACAESIRYGRQYDAQGNITKDGEHADLFPAKVGEWAIQHSDELSMLALELEDNELITD